MSLEQRQAADALMRDAPLDIGGEVAEQRAIAEQMMASFGRHDDVATSDTNLGRVPATFVEAPATLVDRVVLYLHGGAYALGSATGAAGLAAEVGRRTRARAYSLEYRRAPESPYPAAVEDCIAAYRDLLDSGFDARQIALAGESAGAGLVAATLVGAKTAGLPQPACAALMSPWVDLTLTSPTLQTKADVDPVLTVHGLRRRADDYLAEVRAEAASPLFADLSGIAPILIQAGSHEIHLGDAIGLAGRVAEQDGRGELQVWPGVPHVFQSFATILDEGTQPRHAGRVRRGIPHSAGAPANALDLRVVGSNARHRAKSFTRLVKHRWLRDLIKAGNGRRLADTSYSPH